MKKLIIPIFVGCLSVSFTLLPDSKSVAEHEETVNSFTVSEDSLNTATPEDAVSIYQNICLAEFGLSKEALEYALKGYHVLLDQKKIRKEQYLTICDFSQPSSKKRLYIIDIENQQLLVNTYVAHGRNSGGEYATQFSNRPESLQSSLGFYITENTYIGKHGLSLRVTGVEQGINDNAMERTIVIHGAEYVDPSRAKSGVFMGRSWGCPAVPKAESNHIISLIKNGSCLFIYHPQKKYLQGSKILNG